MSHTHPAVQTRSGDAQIIEAHNTTDPHGEHDNPGTDSRGPRSYHRRPEPPRRTDLMGFNSTLWTALGRLILILLIVFPFPFWSW
jgi:hypothetical protein